MPKTRETIKKEKAEAARQRKRDEAFRAASRRQGTRTGLRSSGHQNEIQAENVEHHTVGVQTMLSGPVLLAIDQIRIFPVSIKMLLGLMVGLSGLMYYLYRHFQ